MGKWHVFAVGIMFLILAGLIYLTSDARPRVSGPEMLVREALAPFQHGFSAVSRWTVEAVQTVGSVPGLRRENRELRQEVALLEARLSASSGVFRENDQLRRVLGLQPHVEQPSVVARVIARPSEHWFSTITLGRGANHGLAPGLPVVDVRGVVGHIESVTPNTARVILVVDPKSAVGGMIYSSEAPVLVEGIGDPAGQRAMVHPLVRDVRLSAGDEVVTSGLSRIYPRGIPIGVVERVEEVGLGLQHRAVLRPHVDFSRLEWVTVLLETEGDVAWPSYLGAPVQ